jgi:Leucine-rich repeat (LRR) protein
MSVIMPAFSQIQLVALAVLAVLGAAETSDEKQGLLNLYASTCGGGGFECDGWLVKDGWSTHLKNASTQQQFLSNTSISACAMPPNNWDGIICDETGPNGSIVGISLSGNGLSGQLPSEGFFEKLHSLTKLVLANNKLLNGTIPAMIAKATSLRTLELYNCALSGTIPSALGELTGFDGRLDLHFNFLSGILPPELSMMTALTYFSAASNNMTGSIPWSWRNLSNLTTLGLAHNRLTGGISMCGEEAMPEMEVFYVRNNTLNGTVPAMSNDIAVLDLDQNKFTALSDEFLAQNVGKMKALKANGCDQDWPTQPFFTACLAQNPWGYKMQPCTSHISKRHPIPTKSQCFLPDKNKNISTCMQNKDKLETFGFHCPCTGASATLPYTECMAWQSFAASTIGSRMHYFKEFCSMHFDVDNPCACGFTLAKDDDGWEYDAYGIGCTQRPYHKVITEISFFGNYARSGTTLNGTLPLDFTQLSHLRLLNLGANVGLRGQILEQLTGLKRLEEIIMYNTNLEGTIPASIGSLPKLHVLDLSCNSFTGSIPPELARITNLRYLKLAANRLSGNIPALDFQAITHECDLEWRGAPVQKYCGVAFAERNKFANAALPPIGACDYCTICSEQCNPDSSCNSGSRNSSGGGSGN